MDEKERLQIYQTLINALNNKNNDTTEDDKTFRKHTTKEITHRDTKYTELLSHFVTITKIRNFLKEFFKWTFYITIIIAIIALVIIVYKLFNKYIASATIEQILDSAPLLITAMVGFVSTIITIPVTITKYLFSTEEDKNITEIILHTQEHDTSGRQWATDFIVDDLEKKNDKSKKQNKSCKISKSTPYSVTISS